MEKTSEFIIIADDSPQDSLVLKTQLESRGYTVIDCPDGRAAWDMLNSFEKSKVIALFLDILMPKMNGLDLAQKIRDDKRFKHIPIFITTAHAKQNFVLKSVKMKLNGFIVKPITKEKISRHLNEFLTSKPADYLDYKKGQTIFEVGTSSTCLYFIESGYVGIFKSGSYNIDIPVGIVGPGEYLGEMALICETPHSSKAIALSPVKATSFTKAEIEILLENSSKPVTTLLIDLIQRLRKANEILAQHKVIDASLEERIQEIERSQI